MKMTGTMQQMRAVHVALLELCAQMTRETEGYHTTRLPGRGVPWPHNRYGRRAGIGDGANRCEHGRWRETDARTRDGTNWGIRPCPGIAES